MIISEFVSYLHDLDVNLWYEGDRLCLNAPKGVLTPDLRAELAQRKAEILAFLQVAKATKQTTAPLLQPVPRGGRLPLSFPQQRLWFLDQLEPDNAAYTIPQAVHLAGILNLGTLERSLSEIVRRHEVLRTTFVVEDGQPVQRIAPPEPFTLSVVNLRDVPDPVREAEAKRLINEEALRPFDLAKGPLFRAVLLQLAEEEYVLLLTMHHIVSDGWSAGVFIRELRTLYQAFSQGKPSPLPELPIQYADFAYWQRQWLQGEILETQLAYWKQQLGGDLPVLEVPTDHSRPATQTFRGGLQSFILSPATLNSLKALSQQEGSSLFMALLAAFKILLYRYTGQPDIIVGSPIANRNQVELEGLLGLFINTLVLRTNLSGNPSFRELLGRVREVALGAYAHQDLPFELLVETLHPERDASRSPLFQVMLILQNAPMEELELPGLILRTLETEGGTAKFDLTLYMWDQPKNSKMYPQGFHIFFEYASDLFEAPTITRMMGHFQTLLEAIVATPDQGILDLPLLTEAERHTLLVEWNRCLTDASHHVKGHSLSELFEAQVARTPRAIAAVFEDHALSYGELNEQANRLADYLRGLGVGPDVLVGICAERSLEMLVGLLGVLKAGGAYVPLDPMFPRERLAYMVEDASLSILLTKQRVLDDVVNEMLANTTQRPLVICLDEPWEAHAAVVRSDVVASPDNLAYVIYTSGSTGRPKGVQVVQRAVVNFMASMRLEPGLSAKDTLLAVTTLSFDIAGLELFLPLTVGARVVIASSSAVADGPQLMTLMEKSKVTVMQATPATWRMLIQSGWSGDEHLKILCGGEALPRELADQMLGRCSELWNMYGPTETTIWSTVDKVAPGEGVISIGRPIAHTQVYILDAHMQPVPIGIVGDLYIGGDGLARGYLNRPELTAEKFIRDPFSPDPQARMYKTGDVARYRANSTIEFLGRSDHQVKIRGFRIELGEIEAVLAQHAQVRQALMVARADTNGDKRLVAYVITRTPAPSVSELRRFLKEQLPDYMVPAAFMMMDAFPLTPNGKVDRKALPAPDSLRPQLDANYVEPQTDIERTLVGIWQDVLKVDKVGVHDNFFELGGHSLLIVQVHTRLQSIASAAITIADMFRYPTIAALANFLAREPGESPSFQKVQDRVMRRRAAQQLRHEKGIAL